MITKNLVHQAVLAGHSARFTLASDMLHDLAAQDSSASLARRLRRYTGPALGGQVGMIVVGFAPAIMTSLEGAGGLGWLPVAGFGALCLSLAAGAAFVTDETAHRSLNSIDTI